MNITKRKKNNIKLLFMSIMIVVLIFIVKNGINTLKTISKSFIVEDGTLKFEESARGYILRDETILQGENFKNGMIQIITEGERVSKGKPVFRYYSNAEEEAIKQINALDDEINATIEGSGIKIFSNNDIVNLEKEIKNTITLMYKVNNMDTINDKITEINTYLTKKTKITGILSPADSYVKTLIEKRNNLESSLTTSSEIMYAQKSGVVSYKIDGFEEKLGITDLSYLSSDYLEGLDLKVGSLISTNTECGKIINNFYCYIACPIDSEKALSAQIGDKLNLRLLNGDEIPATIEYIADQDEKRVIVFKIVKDVEELVEYRKIDVDIIWWNYTGLKISNSAIQEENDISYVEKSKAGYTTKIYVKVLRQNETYSIIENYSDEELREIGMDDTYIKNRSKISAYDEILLH